MFNPTRDQARRVFIESWRKKLSGEALDAMEQRIADLIASHPEYHALLEQDDAALQDFTPETGQMNPFLHLSLHLAIEEQLAIDQPPGIVAAYQVALQVTDNPHTARHVILEALAEVLWDMQRNQQPLDPAHYLARIQQLARR